MSGISVKLPLTIDDEDGAYKLNKTLVESVKQNFRMLLLTSPGEKIMDPLFGVGIREYLFEYNGEQTYAALAEKIREQTAKYMPFLDVVQIDIFGATSLADKNVMNVSIEYKILPLDVNDILNISEEID